MRLSVSRLLSFTPIVSSSLIYSNVIASSHHAGATLGSLSVDAIGLVNYSVEIQVLPGTAAMQPSLSLNYNSNNGGGILGVRWSLGGIQFCLMALYVE